MSRPTKRNCWASIRGQSWPIAERWCKGACAAAPWPAAYPSRSGSVTLNWDTELGQDVTIGPNVVFGPGVKIASNVEIRAFCHSKAFPSPRARNRPFARLRPPEIGETPISAIVVEVKKAVIEAGAKVNHLTYYRRRKGRRRRQCRRWPITCNYERLRQAFHR